MYLALATTQVQRQLQMLERGSVVDTLYEADVAEVVLPPHAPTLGRRAARAWGDFALAHSLRSRAVALVEAALSDPTTTTRDLLLTTREAAALWDADPAEVGARLAAGQLHSVGRLDEANALIGLDDALGSAWRDSGGAGPRHGRAMLHGQVLAVGDEEFTALVGDEPDQARQDVVIPLRLLAEADRARVRVGDRFTWTVAAGQGDGDAQPRWSARCSASPPDRS